MYFSERLKQAEKYGGSALSAMQKLGVPPHPANGLMQPAQRHYHRLNQYVELVE